MLKHPWRSYGRATLIQQTQHVLFVTLSLSHSLRQSKALQSKKRRMRALSHSSSIPSLLLFVLVILFSVRGLFADRTQYDQPEMATPGGLRESQGFQNSAEIEGLARFAVDAHNKRQNSLLEFARVVRAQEQVVTGTLHHLTIEAIEGGQKKIYEAKIWVKPWMNFKELQEFKPAGDAPSFTTADLGLKRDGHAPGWQTVPVHDPQVQDAANQAVKTIQERSNSLLPYVLHEVVHAKAEVIDDSAKFDMLLKVKRGDKEEKFKVEVHKNNEGSFLLNQMQQDHS